MTCSVIADPVDGLHLGAYVFRTDGPHGDDEGVVVGLREYTAIVYSYVLADPIVYARRDLTLEPA